MDTPKGFQTLMDYFRQRKWHFEAMPEKRRVQASFAMRNGTFRLAAVVDENDNLLQVFTAVPVIVPLEKRAAMAELCVRISRKLLLGSLELDFEDGELRMYTGLAFPKGDLADELIERATWTNLVSTDTHFPALMAVIYAGQAPEEALREVEMAGTHKPKHQRETLPIPPARLNLN